jgi:CspA family cold shock protein
MAENQRHFGIVREFSMSRGKGLIELDGSGTAVLVRYSAIQGEGVRLLRVGQRVSFELEQDKRGLSALRVVCE